MGSPIGGSICESYKNVEFYEIKEPYTLVKPTHRK